MKNSIIACNVFLNFEPWIVNNEKLKHENTLKLFIFLQVNFHQALKLTF